MSQPFGEAEPLWRRRSVIAWRGADQKVEQKSSAHCNETRIGKSPWPDAIGRKALPITAPNVPLRIDRLHCKTGRRGRRQHITEFDRNVGSIRFAINPAHKGDGDMCVRLVSIYIYRQCQGDICPRLRSLQPLFCRRARRFRRHCLRPRRDTTTVPGSRPLALPISKSSAQSFPTRVTSLAVAFALDSMIAANLGIALYGMFAVNLGIALYGVVAANVGISADGVISVKLPRHSRCAVNPNSVRGIAPNPCALLGRFARCPRLLLGRQILRPA